MDDPTLITVAISAVTALGGVATSVGHWVAKQLQECKSEHRESRIRIEELHEEIREISTSVGEMRGQLTVYQRDQNEQNQVDTHKPA
jgi:TolA-binding protein